MGQAEQLSMDWPETESDQPPEPVEEVKPELYAPLPSGNAPPKMFEREAEFAEFYGVPLDIYRYAMFYHTADFETFLKCYRDCGSVEVAEELYRQDGK